MRRPGKCLRYVTVVGDGPARADPPAPAPDRDGHRRCAPGLVLRDADGVLSVISFTVDRGRIAAIDVVRNPDKLTGVREPG